MIHASLCQLQQTTQKLVCEIYSVCAQKNRPLHLSQLHHPRLMCKQVRQ